MVDAIQPILSSIQSKLPNTDVLTKQQMEFIKGLGYATEERGWIKEGNTYSIVRLQPETLSIDYKQVNNGHIFLLIKSNMNSKTIVDTLMTTPKVNSVSIKYNLSCSILNKVNARTLTQSFKRVMLLFNYTNTYYTFTQADAQGILGKIQKEYIAADFTSEDTMNMIRQKQLGMCLCGWYKSTQGDIKIGYISPDGFKNLDGCGAGKEKIVNCELSWRPNYAMYITIETNESPAETSKKIREIINTYTNKSGAGVYIVYDEANEGIYEYTGTVQSIDVQTMENTNAIVQLLGDGDRVLTQRLATSSTLEFNQIDVVPTLSYRDLEFPAQGNQRIRLESFVGQGWFLTIDGVKGEISKTAATTFTLKPSTLFRSPSSLSPSSSVAKVYTLESGTTKLFRNSSNGIGGTITTNIDANSSWVILPALNGASAFVSLQLANYPRVFLTTQVNADGSYTPLCVELGLKPTDLEKALTCWKLYPSDM